ncbi:hypothetical protein [Neochlamydia sp. S13]|uniref:hypothetical protein n=1 Tax=Neochlamydia sp. S13 TaxID=1353976 RepID=UPI0005A93D2B|nr:hypothetical protein [Neochlamydia sp. S13]BBI18034.1 Uncharacterized protein NCS13_1_1839 [Neochlamydia sp. S13]
MKILLSFLGASFLAASFLTAAPAINNCECSQCTCTQDKHCGCYAKSGCHGLSPTATGEESSQEKNSSIAN